MKMKFNLNSANKMLNKALKNKYVLYVLYFISVANILAYLSAQNYKAILFFFCVGLLSTYFSKNMIINLALPILLTNLVYGKKTYEGFREAADGEDDSAEMEMEVEEEPEEEEEMEEEGEDMEEEEEEIEEEEDMEEPEEGTAEADDSLYMSSDVNTAFTLMRPMEGMTNRKKQGKKGAKKQGKKSPKKQGFQAKYGHLNRPKSKPKSLTDEKIGERVDYAATLEQAYDNLQGMLGKEGISGLTKETQHLINQQKNLMGTLGEIQPLIKNAKETLTSINMGELNKGISSITGMLSSLKK